MNALYGLSKRLNIGLAARYRFVQYALASDSPLNVFSSMEEGNSRNGLTAIGPHVRWAPVPKWTNFTVQSTYTIATGKNLSGSADAPYIDWDGHSWYTQFFYDKTLGSQFSFFTDVGFLTESMFTESSDARYNVPVSAILSYYPVSSITAYALLSGSVGSSVWGQSGLGLKYLINPMVELEGLYSLFTNSDLLKNNGGAQTFNLGLRVTL